MAIGIAAIVRPSLDRQIEPRATADLFSGVDLMPTALKLAGATVPEQVQGVSHAIRAIRTQDFSYIENLVDRDHFRLSCCFRGCGSAAVWRPGPASSWRRACSKAPKSCISP